MAAYASSEINAIGDGIGEPLSQADLDFGSSPPSYYPSVVYPSGLPMVVHEGRLYGKYGGEWNVNEDKVYVMPSTIEMFVRAFLGHRFGAASQYTDEDDDGGSRCDNANDCSKCPASGVRKECILNEWANLGLFAAPHANEELSLPRQPALRTPSRSSDWMCILFIPKTGARGSRSGRWPK